MTSEILTDTSVRASHGPRAGGVTRARVAWGVATGLAVAAFAAGLPYQYRRFLALRGPDPYGDDPARVRAGLHAAGISARTYADAVLTLDLVLAGAFVAIALVVFARRGRDRWTLAFSFALVAFGTTFSLVPQALADAHPVWQVPVGLLQLAGLAGGLAALLWFPDGRPVPRWTLPLAVLYAAWEAARLLSHRAEQALDPTAPVIAVVVVAGLVSAHVVRYRHVSSPVERQQTKVAVLGIVGAMLGYLVFGYAVPAVAPGADAPGSVAALLLTAALFASLLLIPTALAAALLRYRLWDVDLVLNRSLVYAGLTLCVAGIYAVVVAGLGAAVDAGGRLWPSLLATAAVAVALNPLHSRLQRAVNRLLYGRRDEPFTVLAELGLRLERAVEPDELLQTVVDGVRGALRLSYAAIALEEDDGELLVESGTAGSALATVPLVHQGLRQGELRAAARPGEAALHPRDLALLERIAGHAALTAQTVRLGRQLQRSRERTVAAREEERRRLRRDLHDGLGPALASLRLKLAALRRLVPPDADTAERFDDLRDDLGGLVADVRRLVHGLRPPALDDLGLPDAVGELAQEARRTGLEVGYARPALTQPLPAAVEVAAYRIAQEAVANVLRHARARSCRISLRVEDEALRLAVEDDGVGLPEHPGTGVGLRSMEERATELGGTLTVGPGSPRGTRVRASIPLTPGQP